MNNEDKTILDDLANKINGTIPIQESKVKKLKEDNEICEAFEKARKVIRRWMKDEENIEKHVIKIPSNANVFILNFFESYFQMKYKPKFEGLKKQAKGE